MKKVVIIAKNEKEVNSGAEMFKNFKCRKVYPGAKRFPRSFEAVIIYHSTPNDVNFIKDDLQRYKDAPIKIFCGAAPYT